MAYPIGAHAILSCENTLEGLRVPLVCWKGICNESYVLGDGPEAFVITLSHAANLIKFSVSIILSQSILKYFMH